MPFTIHPVAPVFTAVAPLDGPSGVPGEDAQVFVVNAQPENGSWLADVAFDTQRRLEWIRRILETEQAYSVVERARIATGMALLGSFEVGRDKAKALKHTTATLHGARTKHDPRTGHLIGEAQAVVNTSVMDLLAYMMQMDSRHVMSTCDRAVFNRCEVLEIVNCHHIVLFTETRPGKPVQTRTFLSSVLCTKLWDEQKKAHTSSSYSKISLEDLACGRGEPDSGRGRAQLSPYSARTDENST